MKRGLTLLITYSAGVAAIFLTGYFSDFIDLWQSFFAALVIAVIFVLHLYKTQVPKKTTGKKKPALVSALVILFSLQTVASYILYEKSVYHKELLRDIRSRISESLLKMEMERALQHTLRTYYLSEDNKTESLESTFRHLMNDRFVNNNMLSAILPGNNEDFSIYYDFASPDSLILTAVAKVAYGTDPEFDNLDDKTGMLQAKSTLTKNGWTYAREN